MAFDSSDLFFQPWQSRWRMRPVIAIAAVGMVILTGCQSPRSAVAEREQKLAKQFVDEAQRLDRLEERQLNWHEALDLMMEGNLEIKEAENRVLSSKEAIERVFLDLLPAVNITTSLTKGLTDLGSVTNQDFNFSIYSIVSIPGLVSLRVRYYGAALQHIRSQWALELKQRELTIRLYEVFIRQRILAQRERSLRFANLWQVADPFSEALLAAPVALERQSREWALQREKDSLQTDLARLLGSYEARWIPLPDTIPLLDYHRNPVNIEDTDRFGVLLRQLQAAELEGARVRELGVELRYWPDVGVNIISPPIYQVAGGQTTQWNIDQMLVNMSANMQLDTRLQIAYQLRDVRRQIELLRERLLLENTLTLQRLDQARVSLDLNARQLTLTELRIRSLRDESPTLNPLDAKDQVERILLLDEQRASLELEKAQLESLFWIMDESRWRNETPATPTVAPSDQKLYGKVGRR